MNQAYNDGVPGVYGGALIGTMTLILVLSVPSSHVISYNHVAALTDGGCSVTHASLLTYSCSLDVRRWRHTRALYREYLPKETELQ